jgi:hypothetical protein
MVLPKSQTNPHQRRSLLSLIPTLFTTVPKEIRIDLAWSCFDASYCPRQALRGGSRNYESSIYYVTIIRRCSLFPSCCRNLYSIVWLGRPSNALYEVELLQLSVYQKLSSQDHHFLPHDLLSILLEHLLLRSDPMLRQAVPLLYP